MHLFSYAKHVAYLFDQDILSGCFLVLLCGEENSLPGCFSTDSVLPMTPFLRFGGLLLLLVLVADDIVVVAL